MGDALCKDFRYKGLEGPRSKINLNLKAILGKKELFLNFSLGQFMSRNEVV